MRASDLNNECPMCGGTSIKKDSILRRIRNVGANFSLPSVASIGSNVKLSKSSKKHDFYYQCNGCKMEYIRVQIDIGSILKLFSADRFEAQYIADMILHYYGQGVSVTDLLTKYVTGIIRRHNNILPYVSNSLVRRNLYVCFKYQGIRTYAILVKKKQDKYYYYTIKYIGIPGI